jgi:glycosyltransferase involved in cell wall biosynthesis
MGPDWNVVCFSGVDWKSHRQRPHWLMSAFAERGARVLFVDNLGTRLPRLRDTQAVARKLSGWARSSRTARPGGRGAIRVDSPVVLPLQHLGLVRRIGRATLVRRLRRRLSPSRPLVVWTYLPLPVIADTAKALGADLLVYDWSDDARERVLSPSARQRARIGRWEDQMAERADVVFVASAELLRSRAPANPRTFLVPHGAPRKGREGAARPEPHPSLADLPRPRIGYIGSISEWTDLDLVDRLARERPGWSFVMVGPVRTRAKGLRQRPNVILTGERPHEEIPSLLAGFDVAIIPYRVSPAMAAASPVKLREYLAAGLPVVSVDVPEVREFAPPVRVASGPEEFLAQIEAALTDERPRHRRSPRATSWEERAEEMIARMSEALHARR